MSTVLFVCLQNAGRSQMSQALLTRAAGNHQALSAGTTSATHIHPEVITAMREVGIDLADRRPQLLTPELADQTDLVITMGCGDQCAYIPGKRYIDWELSDPEGQPIEQVRAIRDESTNAFINSSHSSTAPTQPPRDNQDPPNDFPASTGPPSTPTRASPRRSGQTRDTPEARLPPLGGTTPRRSRRNAGQEPCELAVRQFFTDDGLTDWPSNASTAAWISRTRSSSALASTVVVASVISPHGRLKRPELRRRIGGSF